jgi:predicted 3-demethylubiquinone-9 3-methyltransferase (glyoxalase superfamily)
MPTLTNCLWFDRDGEAAAELYTSVFPNSRILGVTHHGEAGPRDADLVLTVEFELDGVRFVALNGGPDFTFNEAVSFQIECDSQDEIDHYTDKLTADGGEQGPCGWIKDRFGVSWQVMPRVMKELLADDAPARDRVMAAMMRMRKLDLAALEDAAKTAA